MHSAINRHFLRAERERGERAVAVKPDLHFVVRQIPIDRDVGKQKTQRQGRTGKGQTGLLANDAMRPLAADKKLRADRFLLAILMADHGVHTICCLVEADQFPASFHSVTAFGQRRLENLLGHALWNDNHPRLAGIASRLVGRKLHPDREMLLRARVQIDGANSIESAREKFGGDSKDRENFREARLQSERL